MAKSKGSGFSGSAPTVNDLATKFAEASIANTAGTYNPYDVDYLPSFVTDKLSQQEYYAASVGDPYVKRETEKAVLIGYSTDYGEVTLWSPKSVIKTQDELRERALNTYKRQYVNDSYYNYLRNTAKTAGVKLGSVKKWDKIKQKLTQSGVSFMEKDVFANSRA